MSPFCREISDHWIFEHFFEVERPQAAYKEIEITADSKTDPSCLLYSAVISPMTTPADEDGFDEKSAILIDRAQDFPPDFQDIPFGPTTPKVFTADDWKIISPLVDQLSPTCILDFQSKANATPELMSGYAYSFRQGEPNVQWPLIVYPWIRNGGDVRMVIHVHTNIPWEYRKKYLLEDRLQSIEAVNLRYAFKEKGQQHFRHTWKPTQKLNLPDANDWSRIYRLIQNAHNMTAVGADFWFETESRAESDKRLRSADFQVIRCSAPAADSAPRPPSPVHSFCIGIDRYGGKPGCVTLAEHLQLDYAVADARAFHDCVEAIGGDSVMIENPQSSFAITGAFRDFLKGLISREPKVVFLYCAGHGVQVRRFGPTG